MRAAIFNGSDTLEIGEVKVADPAPGQVAGAGAPLRHLPLRLHRARGGMGMSPQILGHEAAGIVDAVGDGVELLEVGDQVVLTPIASCGRCYWCTRAQSRSA